MDMKADADLGDFKDDEIKAEYIERFGDPDDVNLSDFSASDLIEELEHRGRMPEPDGPEKMEEIADLIAEAARTSKHAASAYGLLLEEYPEFKSLSWRQTLIAGRMKDAA
jgi:hypothetical protein